MSGSMDEAQYCAVSRDPIESSEYLNNELLPVSNVMVPSWTSFRPRGSLARVLYQKQQHDEFLSHFDKNEWYQCDLTCLTPELALKFVQLELDEDTENFLEQSERKSDWILTQIWHSVVKAVLGLFMTQTSINGWLQRGSMFVISKPQLRKLLKVDKNWKADSLLDLGAGDGEVTAHLEELFSRVYVTEMSGTMRNLLHRRGYQLLDIESWHLDRKFDVISCLNLIDRCDTPLQLLDQIKSSLKPDGFCLLAVVLPFSAYVESGAPDNKPQELLPIIGSTFEKQVESVVNDVLIPAQFEVVSWSRVPYLCEGDLQQSYYWLDDVIFVLRLADTST